MRQIQLTTKGLKNKKTWTTAIIMLWREEEEPPSASLSLQSQAGWLQFLTVQGVCPNTSAFVNMCLRVVVKANHAEPGVLRTSFFFWVFCFNDLRVQPEKPEGKTWLGKTWMNPRWQNHRSTRGSRGRRAALAFLGRLRELQLSVIVDGLSCGPTIVACKGKGPPVGWHKERRKCKPLTKSS